MGCVCSCMHVPETLDDIVSSNQTYQDCKCPKCRIQRFLDKYLNLFSRETPNSIFPAPSHADLSDLEPITDYPSTASSSHDGEVPNSFTSMNFQGRCVTLERKRENSRVILELVGQTCSELRSDVNPENMLINSVEVSCGITGTLPSRDDEDECVICLEEYTFENPKIITKCSHAFHLGCIYEWLERSISCPLCAKLLLFADQPC